MTLVVAFKGTEGIVLAADSRVTLMSQGGHPSNFDNATKLLTLSKPHNWVGAVTSGVATISGRTHHSLMPEFEASLGSDRLSVREYAEGLSAFFLDKWTTSGQSSNAGNAEFIVAGYDVGQPYGTVYRFAVPGSPNLVEHIAGTFGMTYSGQRIIADRIMYGYDPQILSLMQSYFSLPSQQVRSFGLDIRRQVAHRTPYVTLALQDCVDLSTFLIRTTIEAQSFSTDLRGVGGPIDVATIGQVDGFNWVNRKHVQGG